MEDHAFSFCFSFFTPLLPWGVLESFDLAADLATTDFTADLEDFLTDFPDLSSLAGCWSLLRVLLAGSGRFLLNLLSFSLLCLSLLSFSLPPLAMLTLFLELVFPLSFLFS